MGRRLKYRPLEPEDVQLIAACKHERDRIDRQLKALREGDPIANFARIQRLKRERAELTDNKLAEKMEATKYQVQCC